MVEGGASEGAADPDALRYDKHWRPILDGATERLLDRLDAPARGFLAEGGDAPLLLDVGSGTGALLVAAGRRWPGLELAGLDATAAMLGLARQRAASAGLRVADDDAAWHVADAARLPVQDATARIVASSFVLQLVSDRATVLAEVRRVLSSGGMFGFVTWLAEDSMLTVDEAFDDAVYELELDEPDAGFRMAKAGDFESVETATAELRTAGFEAVDARPDELVHAWTPESFLAFKRGYDEKELFDSLSVADRVRLADAVRRRYAELPDSAFVLRAPLVSVVASRP